MTIAPALGALLPLDAHPRADHAARFLTPDGLWQRNALSDGGAMLGRGSCQPARAVLGGFVRESAEPADELARVWHVHFLRTVTDPWPWAQRSAQIDAVTAGACRQVGKLWPAPCSDR
ncbi:DUF6000 family protein [Streptomyces sp. NPDC001599]|uniref:DUF6000 family protein n=1 Tax=Streptomyces sp. NPDC001599 TaxID=3364591 RepID=UPI0036C6D8B3